jgi:hypothetical protein
VPPHEGCRLPLNIGFLPLPVDPISKAMTHPLRSTGITPLQHYYEAVRPSPAHQYFRPCGWSRLCLVWGFRSQAEIYHLHLFLSFFLSFVPSLCSTGAIIPSSRPALRSRRRAGAVKVGRRTPTLRHAPPLPPHLDSFEPDGTLGAIGMTIRGEPAFGRGSIAPQPCIRWVQGPEP